MSLQVLVATMNQNDYSLLEKMNIKSDAIIANQCNRNSIESLEYQGHCITYLNFSEIGVGLNRNNALMRASGDYCLFADDDMIYFDDYVDIVINAFNTIKDADVIIFNIKEAIPTRYIIKKKKRVWFHNYLRYGTARIGIRLDSVKENTIYFNECFGGGTEHCHGEDSLFLTECLKKGLKIYAVPDYIAYLTDDRPSTWNEGYDFKYIIDQGFLYKAISPRFYKLLCFQDAFRRAKKDYHIPIIYAYSLMVKRGL